MRVLINGSPIASFVSPRMGAGSATAADRVRRSTEGIARDRWDVAIETVNLQQATILVACGAVASACLRSSREGVRRRESGPGERC